MYNDYLKALQFTLKEEGGFSDNKNDHGGETNCGVTQNTFDLYLHLKSLPAQDVSTITRVQVFELYHILYWMPGYCDKLPLPLAVCHFDWCVNHGVHGATFALQSAAGVTMDGQIGPKTLAACQDPSVPAKYLDYRRNWYKKDVNNHPDQEEFLDGWLKRVDQLQEYINNL